MAREIRETREILDIKAFLDCSDEETRGLLSLKLLRIVSIRPLNTNEQNQFIEFCKKIESCDSLQYLDLSYTNLNKLSPTDFQNFCKALSTCQSLQILKLGFTGFDSLDDSNVQLFFNAIASCKRLQILDLSGNSLCWHDAASLHAFSSILVKCKRLHTLKLNSSFIGKIQNIELFNIFCNALLSSRTLKNLELRDNGLGYLEPEMFKVLCETFASCQSLQSLELGFNNLTQEQIDFLQQPIELRKRARVGAEYLANIELFNEYKTASPLVVSDDDSSLGLIKAISILRELPPELRMSIISYVVGCKGEDIKKGYLQESYNNLKHLFKKHKALNSYRERMRMADEARGFENLHSQITYSFLSPESRLVLSAFNDYKVRKFNEAYNLSNPGKEERGCGPMAMVPYKGKRII